MHMHTKKRRDCFYNIFRTVDGQHPAPVGGAAQVLVFIGFHPSAGIRSISTKVVTQTHATSRGSKTIKQTDQDQLLNLQILGVHEVNQRGLHNILL